MVYCTHCNAQNNSGSTYCYVCKTGLTNSQPPQISPQFHHNHYNNYHQKTPNLFEAFKKVKNTEPVSLWNWVLTLFLLSIPVAGIILAFVWGFSDSEKQSKSNFCKAYLIMLGISIVLWVGFMIVSTLFFHALFESFFYVPEQYF
ncbi:MAG: hypothetical protein FWF76_04370 [Oscillospiraceae bacterium]|nr:hypothetical protein [Oscillospiraceae bacterium]